MTTTDYIETMLNRQREHDLVLRVEQRRRALERRGRPGGPARARRGLVHLLRHRLDALVGHAPARG
jgi:hypothetical protein